MIQDPQPPPPNPSIHSLVTAGFSLQVLEGNEMYDVFLKIRSRLCFGCVWEEKNKSGVFVQSCCWGTRCYLIPLTQASLKYPQVKLLRYLVLMQPGISSSVLRKLNEWLLCRTPD